MKSIEDWRSRHPHYNDRPSLESLRVRYPERQIWVGDDAGQTFAVPVTAEHFLHDFLSLGYEAFKNRPILPSSVLLQASRDIGVYALGRSIKDPDDASEVLLKRALRPPTITFLEEVIELVEDAHESGTKTDTLTARMDMEAPKLLQLAVRMSGLVDETLLTGQFCNIVWREAVGLEVSPSKK